MPFLSDPTTSLNDKLCLLPHIADEKHLHLYPLCLEGLKSSSRFDQEIAKRALEKYQKFDGMVYNANGDIIDIAKAKELIKTMSTKTNAAEIKVNAVK